MPAPPPYETIQKDYKQRQRRENDQSRPFVALWEKKGKQGKCRKKSRAVGSYNIVFLTYAHGHVEKERGARGRLRESKRKGKTEEVHGATRRTYSFIKGKREDVECSWYCPFELLSKEDRYQKANR